MNKSSKLFIYFLIALVFYFIHESAQKHSIPTEPGVEEQYIADLYEYSDLKDPEQIELPYDEESIILKGKKYDLALYPQAEYRIYAMVVSKYKYSWGWQSWISPFDLALVWNKLMLPEGQKGIMFSQGSRWYYFQYDAQYPFNKEYIETHSANNHIIPANKAILNAIKKVHNKERIYMEGYLVDIAGLADNRDVSWNTSLSRNDTGEGSCEIFYVKRAILNGEIFE